MYTLFINYITIRMAQFTCMCIYIYMYIYICANIVICADIKFNGILLNTYARINIFINSIVLGYIILLFRISYI